MLDEYVRVCGYNRSYGGLVLRQFALRIKIKTKDGKQIILLPSKKKVKRKKPKIYDEQVYEGLKKIWYILDFMCSKRLSVYLREIIPILEKFKEIELAKEVREKLLKISPATIDRLLQEDKKKLEIKCRGRTKPGTLLKNQIPIRTYSDWDEKKVGFVEIDLVSHDGGNVTGDFAQSLDVTDIHTGWTETSAVKNKAQSNVFAGLKEIVNRLPFKILGIDSDNGGEFINAQLLRYCQQNKITFTRSRAYRKNDNCFIEQKNYSIVRRNAGYYRYDSPQALQTLNQLYLLLRLYTNYFQPVMKLQSKTRIKSKVIKKYDRAQTPYQRLLSSPIGEEIKVKLTKEYLTLNPALLKRQLVKLQDTLTKLASKPVNLYPNSIYNFKYVFK